MLRAPGATKHAGPPRTAVGPRQRPGRARRPPAPYSPGPPAPSIRPPGLLPAAATLEASKPRGPWPGRGEGEAPRGARAREPRRPPGALSGSGKGPGGGAAAWGARAAGPAGAVGSPGAALGSRGVGWRGRPGPQRRSTNRRRTRSRQEAREGGRAEGGPGGPVTPPCPGLAAQCGAGRGRPSDPQAPPGVRPPALPGSPPP